MQNIRNIIKSGMIIKVIPLFVFTLLISLFCNSILFASEIIDIGGSARIVGSGRAYNSQEKRADCMFYNPAGLADMANGEVTSMYGQLSGDVTYTFLGGAVPTKWGTIGLGYGSSNTGNLMTTTIEANGQVGLLAQFSYADTVTILTWANSTYKEKVRDNMDYGLRLKFYNKGASAIDGAQGSGFAIDAGGAYEANERLRTSILLTNIIAGVIKWGKGSDEAITKGIKLGFKYLLRENLDLLGDLSSISGTPFEVRLGADWKLKNNFNLRFGGELKPIDNNKKYVNLTAGIGLKFKDIGIDYAYLYDGLYSYNSRHFVSLSASFSLPKAKEVKNEYLGVTPSKAKPDLPSLVPVKAVPVEAGNKIIEKKSGAPIMQNKPVKR